MIKTLKKLLKNVPDTYPDFEMDVVTSCESDNEIAEKVIEYMTINSGATTSEILEYLTNIEELPEIEIVDDDEK